MAVDTAARLAQLERVAEDIRRRPSEDPGRDEEVLELVERLKERLRATRDDATEDA
jgi:hypothetical protein